MEDMIEVLMYVSRFRPAVLEGVPMEELLLFFITFMGSPAYIKNPYLRSRMVEVRRIVQLLLQTAALALSDGICEGGMIARRLYQAADRCKNVRRRRSFVVLVLSCMVCGTLPRW